MLTCFRVSKSTFYNFLSTRQLTKFSSNRIGILGAPFRRGQPKKGVEEAPDALRKHGLLSQLQLLGLDVKDYKNLSFEGGLECSTNHKLKYTSTVAAACEKVSEAVKNILLDGRKCVTIGGDHSLGMGTVHGHSQVHDVCLLWIDAHADINTSQTTPSGNFHGMSCSFLLKELHKYNSFLPEFKWLNPCLDKCNLAYIGLRDIDPGEKLILKKENILHFTMQEVDKLGIYEVTQRALEAINPLGNLSLHVSFDIDSIDKLIAPSTGTPVHGGLTVREILSIAEEVSKVDSFRALDIVEVNPLLGNEQQVLQTLDVATLAIKAFLGDKRQESFKKELQHIPLA
ncbi:hypothetical protein JTE90_001046 [Oedothorax gibbosus]|uniref:Arginase n=1 Tax=Oedothorax gibbosus TaxID=931172 RepID=A0AAV6UHE1_9ARAC|nr:hypothetical protein JTE90_001046 [Oedothorax gibbosus]